jgi:hypothetical protein
MASNYFFTNTQGKFNVNEIILSGTNEIAGLKFTNFPKSRVTANYTWFKQINGGNLNYSVNGVDVANNSNCGAQASNYYAAGTYSVSVPEWATQIAFVLVGAGGGGGTGGRGSTNANGNGGAGGGSGAVLISNVIQLNGGINRSVALVVGNNGFGGIRTLINNRPNIVINGISNGGTNGSAGGDSKITINGTTYTAGGGGGGENGYNIEVDDAQTANGGYRGTYVMSSNRQTGAFGNAASDVILQYGSPPGKDGSPGSDGGDISVTPINNYYLPITSTGGAGGPKGSNGTNPGGDGSGYGAGGGGGGGSTQSGGDYGGAGGDGADGTARIVFYP